MSINSPGLTQQTTRADEDSANLDNAQFENADTPDLQADMELNQVSANGFYTKADLEALGLDPKVAAYLIQDYAHNPDSNNPEVKGESLLRLERMGMLDIKPGANGDQIAVPTIARNGYTVLELVASTSLTSEEASDLILRLGDGFTISQNALDGALDSEGDITARARAQSGDSTFNGNRISNKVLDGAIDSDAQFQTADLVAMGLTKNVANFLTQKGPITGGEIKALVQNDDLAAAKVDEKIQLRVNGGNGEVPAEGANALMLIFLGMVPEQAAWLIDAYGDSDGKISEQDLASKTTTKPNGDITLSDAALKEFQGRSTPEANLTANGADYSDLVALGMSSSQANYLLASFGTLSETDAGAENTGTENQGVIPKEKLEELKSQGILVPDPAYTDQPRYMLGGEAGMPAAEAKATASLFANGKPPEEPVLEIAPDGTGNFFTAGADGAKNPGGIDTQQSVIFARTKDENGALAGGFEANNGNLQGHYDAATLTALGFSEDQVTAIFNDKGNPRVLTMSELRDAVARDVGGSSAVAEVAGQALIMRAEGEPVIKDSSYENPLSPTQQDAQWLNEAYGGGDGLTEAELALALEEGAVQIIDGKVLMTAHGKSQAHAEFGHASDSSLQEQQSILRTAMRAMTANQTGTQRTLDEKALISMHNGDLLPADAKLILETYGDGKIVSQDQLWAAIQNDELIISKTPADETVAGSRDAFSLKITPKGYDNMADQILADANHPLTIQTNGALSYPDPNGKTEINVDGLMQQHGLSAKDANVLMVAYDKDSNGSLNQREMLSAIMAGDITLDENNKIIAVNIEASKDSKVGPYSREALAEKISSEQPPAQDLADAIFLDLGLDPMNADRPLTDAEVESWLRDSPILAEDNNGMLTVIEHLVTASIDDVWAQLGGQQGTISIPLDRGSSFKGSAWETQTTLSQGDTYTLSTYLFNQRPGKEGQDKDHYHMTKTELAKLVDDGILGLDENGNVALTEKGQAFTKALRAKDAMDFIGRAVENGDGGVDPANGIRFIKGDYWGDDGAYQQGNGEDWSNDRSRDAGFKISTDQHGQNVTGFYWSLSQGHERLDRKDGDTLQHETVGGLSGDITWQ